MVIPHVTTFDAEGSKELIQGMGFHKKKFEDGIDYRCSDVLAIDQSYEL